MKTDIDFAGIANAPSDYNSADGVMAHLVNLIPEDNELKAVGKGTVLFTVPEDYTLAYVHQVKSDSKHYIFIKKETDSEGNITSTLYWRLASVEEEETAFNKIGTVNGTPKLVSIGNTLIAYSQDEMRYFLWKEVKQDDGTHKFTYKDLGNHLPEFHASFGLIKTKWNSGAYAKEPQFIDQITFTKQPKWGHWSTDETYQRNLENQVCSIANVIVGIAHKYGNFIFPFFVRYAYRLYDGTTLTMHSSPVLMLPSAHDAIYIDIEDFVEGKQAVNFAVNAQAGNLFWKVDTSVDELLEYSDIIKSVDIFVSAPIYTYRQSGYDSIDGDHNYAIYKSAEENTGKNRPTYGLFATGLSYMTHVSVSPYNAFIRVPNYDYEDIEKDVKGRGLFYLFKSIPIADINNYNKGDTITQLFKVENDYLTSLTSKEVMTDDYNTHCLLRPKNAFVYNTRLNLSNVNRALFPSWPLAETTALSGYVEVLRENIILEPFVLDEPDTFSNFTFIQPDSERATIAPYDNESKSDFPCLYYYYPDTIATSITVKRKKYNSEESPKYRKLELKQHDFLNGSFYVEPFWKWECKLDSMDELWADAEEGTDPTITNNLIINDNNKVYTSEANMPFYFPVTGINTIGTGNILALTSITKALSEGQFGQFPLYAFSDEGIWALALSETGSISSVSPVTRDVCNNEKSITQIDDGIIFSSDRGLMMLTGSDSKCLSEQLDGNWFDGSSLKGWPQLNILFPAFQNYNLKFGSFKEFVKDAVIVYDYPRQRVLVLNVNNDIAMAYSLRSRQWGQVKVGYAIAVANSYPGSVIQVRQFLSFGEREILDISTENSSNVLSVGITRPISFGDKNALKTVNDLIMRGDNVAVVLYGTRNNTDWHLVGSSKNRYLRGLCGSPYKAFRLLFIKQMQPGQIIKGASFEITPKDNNVLR